MHLNPIAFRQASTSIERENQGTAIKGKLTTSEDSDKITTQNRKRF
jgi:hypothetical protein